MKKIKALSNGKLVIAACGLFCICSVTNAQLKLYSNGSLSIGSISQPPNGAELQIIGTSLFSNNISATTSSACIKGANIFSTQTTPDYTWWGDTLSGMFHPALNTLAFTVAGKATLTLMANHNIIIDSSFDDGARLQINGRLNASPFNVYSNTTANNIYSGINWVNNNTTKAWAVKNGGQDEFYVYGNGQAYSYGWNTISDSTLKDHVFNIQNALNKVLLLQGVTYNLKQSSLSPKRQMGLIAQAVERVVPEVVTTNDNGIKTIAYSNMVGLLVEAIKQEDVKINMLQHKVDSLTDVNKQTGANFNENRMGEKREAKLYPCKSCPVNQNATFQCYVPYESKSANLLVFDMNGALKKTILINGKEEQSISVPGGELLAGMYYYSLMIDGNEVDTKKVIVTQN
jgi:hypothetical protein